MACLDAYLPRPLHLPVYVTVLPYGPLAHFVWLCFLVQCGALVAWCYVGVCGPHLLITLLADALNVCLGAFIVLFSQWAVSLFGHATDRRSEAGQVPRE